MKGFPLALCVLLFAATAAASWVEDAKQALNDAKAASATLAKEAARAYDAAGTKGMLDAALSSDAAKIASRHVASSVKAASDNVASTAKAASANAAQNVADTTVAAVEAALGMPLAEAFAFVGQVAFFVFVIATFALSLWFHIGFWPPLVLNVSVVFIGVEQTVRVSWVVLRHIVPFAVQHPAAFVLVTALAFPACTIACRFVARRLRPAPPTPGIGEVLSRVEAQIAELKEVAAALHRAKADDAKAQ
jgi:hypothetical protein